MSKEPVKTSREDLTQEDFEKLEYVPVGTQIGFDPKKLGKIWNALGSFLHVRIPKSKDEAMSSYAEEESLIKQIEKAIAELKRLASGTIILSGLGETVSFKCNCGRKNMRRIGLLREGQVINCINPKCEDKWEVLFEEKEIEFKWRNIPIDCHYCSVTNKFPENLLMDLERNRQFRFECRGCKKENFLKWTLGHQIRTS